MASQDAAFSDLSKQDETFKFEDEEGKVPAPSQGEKTDTDTASTVSEEGDKDTVTPKAGDEGEEPKDPPEEQKVPYSRFKKKTDEAHTAAQRVKELEEMLEKLNKKTIEAGPTEQPPEEWTELYGDGDVAMKAWSVQQKREQKLRQEAVQEALQLLKKEGEASAKAAKDNEDAVEEYLSSLSEVSGKKLSQKQEEDILSIVDEFSPVDDQGKYLSLISPEKALEIYELRLTKKGAPTVKARTKIADAISGNSEGEPDSQGPSFERGWDSWRKSL